MGLGGKHGNSTTPFGYGQKGTSGYLKSKKKTKKELDEVFDYEKPKKKKKKKGYQLDQD